MEVIQVAAAIKHHFLNAFELPSMTSMDLQGAFLSVDYSVGALARILWRMKSAESEALFMPAVATGLIVGDGLWTIPAAVLGFAGVQPPFCMSFNSTN